MHRAINKSAKPLADMCINSVCELLSAQIESQSHVKYARFGKRCTKKHEEICHTDQQVDALHPDLLHVVISSHVLVRICVCGCIHTQKRFEAALM